MRFLYNTYRLLFARARFRKLNDLLFRLGLHGLGILNYQNDEVSGEEYFVRVILPELIRNDPPLLFDVGANEGNYSSLLLSSFPDAIVHAFEPHPKTYARLTARGLPAGRLKCHRIAVGDRRGVVTLYDRADSDGSSHASLHEAVISELHKQAVVSVDVDVDTLDALTERERIEYIDFLKIDTEGHEMAVLKGAERLIRSNRIGCIQFEFNATNVASRVFLRDFRSTLSGYDLFRLLPRGMIQLRDSPLETELFAYQNIVAIEKGAARFASAQTR
jgi:FkbM family methyltransferase